MVGLIFLCWLLVFLAVYPGFFVYDAMEEVNQVVTREFSTHHPLLHVLLLGGVVQAGYKLTGEYNIGIAVYTLCQMLAMAGIFAWSTEWLHKKWKRVLLTLLSAVVCYATVSTGLTAVLRADRSENQEMLTVPIMQLARVYHYEKDSLSQEDLQCLYRYLPEEALERYTPKVSDMVKVGFDNEAFAGDKAGFVKLWFRLLLKHPSACLNAWLMTSYGFWYPDTVIDVYRGNQVFTFQYADSSYFGYEVEQPGHRESKLPVVSMLFSPGFMLWMMLFLLGGFCWKST